MATPPTIMVSDIDFRSLSVLFVSLVELVAADGNEPV
jgi:hypothetical protein